MSPKWIFVLVAAASAGIALDTAKRLDSQKIAAAPRAMVPVCEIDSGGVARVSLPSRILVAEAFRHGDELLAYLTFDYVRSIGAEPRFETLLTYRRVDGRPEYRILLGLPNDLIAAADLLVRLERERAVAGVDWRYVAPEEWARRRRQSRFLIAAYDLPVRRKLEQMSAHELRARTGVFLAFKSATDPRIRKRVDPRPEALTIEQASALAGDILAVTEFYNLPLDLFLGIGAMENNYMNAPGDLGNTTWKRRAEPGDMVLLQRRGRVLVRNDSQGVWQITRETLRQAHRLYLADARDYSKLPERLRPPPSLDIGRVSPGALTTYAGLLLRDLLDHFQNDRALAAGAYNGGVKRPNQRYARGVDTVAGYARSVLERAAALEQRTAVETSFLAPAYGQDPS